MGGLPVRESGAAGLRLVDWLAVPDRHEDFTCPLGHVSGDEDRSPSCLWIGRRFVRSDQIGNTFGFEHPSHPVSHVQFAETGYSNRLLVHGHNSSGPA